MTRKSTASKSATLQQRFLKANDADNLQAMVELARAPALGLLIREGLENTEEIPYINALAGEFQPDGGDDAWVTYCRHLQAAYVLGIAIGQLIDRSVFTKGGAR